MQKLLDRLTHKSRTRTIDMEELTTIEPGIQYEPETWWLDEIESNKLLIDCDMITFVVITGKGEWEAGAATTVGIV